MSPDLANWIEFAMTPRSAVGLLSRISLILAVAWLVQALLARANPRWRVLLWRLAAAAVIVLPGAAWLLPAISLEMLPAETAPIASAPFASAPIQTAEFVERQRQEENIAAHSPEPVMSPKREEIDVRALPAERPSVATPTPTGISVDWRGIVVGAWIVGVVLGFGVEALAWWQLRRLRQRTEPAPADLTELAGRIAERLGYSRSFTVRQTDEVSSPCVVGIWQPLVLLPAVDCQPQQRSSWPGILAHEIAHLAHADVAWDALLRWLGRLLWFHPLAWKMRSAHLAACDAVCDATAADYLGDIDGYSRLLAQMALRVATGGQPPALQMARPSTVRQRIAALQQHVYASPVSRRWVGLAIAGCVVSLFCCAALSLARTQTKDHVDRQGDPLPVGAIARLGTTRYRHGGHYRDVIILPDGVTCLSRTNNSSKLRFWNARTGEQLRELNLGDFGYETMCISPDGSLLGLGGYVRSPDHKHRSELRVMRTESGELLRSFPRANASGCSLAFTPDNKKLLSVASDAILRVEDVSTGEEVAQRKFTVGGAARVSVSPDGKWIGVVTGRGQVFTWDGELDSEPREHKISATQFDSDAKLVFSPDSGLMVMSSRDDNLYVWETSSGKLIRRVATPGQLIFFSRSDFSPDGKRLYTGSWLRSQQQGTLVRDTTTWREIETLDAHGKLSPDGRLLVNGNQVFDLEQRKELNIDRGHQRSIEQILVPNQERILTAGGDGTIREWNAATGEQLCRLEHKKTSWGGPNVSAIALAPDGKQLVSSATDNTVRLWNLAERKEIYRLPGHGSLGANFRAVGFTADGREFCSFGPDYRLRVYDTRRGKALHEFLLKPEGVAFPPDDADPEESMLITFSPAFSPDAKTLAVDYHNKLYLFNTFTGKVLHILEPKGGNMFSTNFSPNGSLLLVSTWGSGAEKEGGGLQLWDVKTGKLVHSIPTLSLARTCFSSDGLRIAVATSDQSITPSRNPTSTIQIFGLDGTLEGTLSPLPESALDLAFTADSKGIITGQSDGNALVWSPDAFVKPAKP